MPGTSRAASSIASALHTTTSDIAITYGTTTTGASNTPPGPSAYSVSSTVTSATSWVRNSRYRTHQVAKSLGGGSVRSGTNPAGIAAGSSLVHGPTVSS